MNHVISILFTGLLITVDGKSNSEHCKCVISDFIFITLETPHSSSLSSVSWSVSSSLSCIFTPYTQTRHLYDAIPCYKSEKILFITILTPSLSYQVLICLGKRNNPTIQISFIWFINLVRAIFYLAFQTWTRWTFFRVKLVFEYDFEISWSWGPWDSWTCSLLLYLLILPLTSSYLFQSLPPTLLLWYVLV